MPTFARHFRVRVDGADYFMTSRPADFLDCELQLAREGLSAERVPFQAQMRIVFSMFRRDCPDHAAAHDWEKFLTVFEDAIDLDEDGSNPLTPTPRADTGN